MKKLLALVLCAVMVLAMIPAVTLTASAAGEGDWTTRRSPKDYDDPVIIAPPVVSTMIPKASIPLPPASRT